MCIFSLKDDSCRIALVVRLLAVGHLTYGIYYDFFCLDPPPRFKSYSIGGKFKFMTNWNLAVSDEVASCDGNSLAPPSLIIVNHRLPSDERVFSRQKTSRIRNTDKREAIDNVSDCDSSTTYTTGTPRDIFIYYHVIVLDISGQLVKYCKNYVKFLFYRFDTLSVLYFLIMALSGIQFVNIIIRLIASVHLSYGAYSMYYATIPPNVLPIDSAFSGKLKYLTFWNVCLETIYFWFAILDGVVSRCSENEKKPLRRIRDHYFLSIVFPLSLFVSVTFWALFAIDRELVMPKAVDAFFPMWLNHTVHTSIVVYSVLELITSYHKCTSTIYKQCFALWSVTLLYVIWCHIVFYKTGLWVYPILSELNLFCRMLFFAGCLALATAFLSIGFYVNNNIWKRRIQTESVKRRKIN